jgi:hypothetical protein
MELVMRLRGFSIAVVSLALTACVQQPTPDLGAALKGIEQSRFLACSGPPILELPQGSQVRMSFVTNLERGDTVGVASPAALAPASCSVDAVFETSRLASARFSGNQSMCQLVFSPCLQK